MSFLPMLHSVSYSGSWGQAALPVEQFIDKAAELGFSGVMLMAKRPHLSALDWDAKARAQLRKQLDQRRIENICIAGYNNFTADLEHGEVPHREIQMHYVTELARLASDLGGGLVRIFTGYESLAAPYYAQWKLVVDALKESARRASEFGVTLGVQNHHDIAAGYESLHDLIRAVNEPNCKAMFDAWAPALHGADLVAAARKLAPVTIQTTVANYQRRHRYHYNPALVNYSEQMPYIQAVPIEEGFIDYTQFLTTLAAGGFQGAVAYEMCSPLLEGGSVEVLDKYAGLFLEFLDRLGSDLGSRRACNQPSMRNLNV
ncbi:MAG: sugar phosphate isomerase/epimerase [Acidobacteria bacterium]|nr:sugar phosphate isomerase/epimerase [Acidobacteriota bacterium]MCI0721275.1 sugar phosphate isomerase/epimerase [Acidobacteriota bacterium]